MRHPTKYRTTGAQLDLVFDNSKCINCTADAVSEFTVEYDDTVALFGNEQKWIGVLGSLRFNDELHVELDVPEDQLKNIPWQYRDYQSVFNGQYADELPPHRSFDHAIDMVEGKEPPWGPIYALSEKELEVLREYLDMMLKSGKIVHRLDRRAHV